MSRKKILYAHAGSGNHGCEAIVRSSVKMIGEDACLFSVNPDQDREYGIGEIVADIQHDFDRPIKRYTLPWLISGICGKLTGSVCAEVYFMKKGLVDAVGAGDVAFSIGGDNYCYPGTDVLGAQNSLFRKKGAKTVLWGCSVEPSLMDNPEIARDMASYHVIVARESISYEALKRVNPNTVLYPDSAFTLDRCDLPLPEGWKEGNTIGINVSPLILNSSQNAELVLQAYGNLIQCILDRTDCTVALIPHVVWKTNDDREILRHFYNQFQDTGRVLMIEDHNCMELKGYIARCRMFVGARTHATIAAYSSCVPTLVLGYSVKSKGIARDLFGTEENYVLPVQQLKCEDELANGFLWLMEKEPEIRSHLQKIMPDYIARAARAGEAVKDL